jgi:hypothetical protein
VFLRSGALDLSLEVNEIEQYPQLHNRTDPVTSECLSSRVEQRNHHEFGKPRTGDKKGLYNGAIREKSTRNVLCLSEYIILVQHG